MSAACGGWFLPREVGDQSVCCVRCFGGSDALIQVVALEQRLPYGSDHELPATILTFPPCETGVLNVAVWTASFTHVLFQGLPEDGCMVELSFELLLCEHQMNAVELQPKSQ